MNDDIVVIDDFFSKSYQKQLYDFLIGRNTIWYFQNSISYPTKEFKNNYANDETIEDTSALAFYLKKPDSNNISEQHKEIVNDFKISIEKHYKTKVKSILKCRALYMSPYSKKQNTYNGPHIDIDEPHKTLIYYVNESDGDTYFFQEKFNGNFDFSKKTLYKTIAPKQGRAILFDGYRYHTGTNPTQNHRILINLNFT